MILVLMLRGGQVGSHHREEVGEGKESGREFIQGLRSSLPRETAFLTVEEIPESRSQSNGCVPVLQHVGTPAAFMPQRSLAGQAHKPISNNGKR